mgnify:CR=1 FL=1
MRLAVELADEVGVPAGVAKAAKKEAKQATEAAEATTTCTAQKLKSRAPKRIT